MNMCCILDDITTGLPPTTRQLLLAVTSIQKVRTLNLQNLSEEQINSYSKFNQKKQFTENICIFGDYKAFRASERHYLKMN